MLMALLESSVLPAVLAGACMVVARFMPGLIATPLRRASFPLGFCFGFWLINSIPAWPPTGSTSSLFYLAIFCFVWIFIESSVGDRFSRVLRWALFALIIFMVLKPLLLDGRLSGDIPFVSGKFETAVHVIMLMGLGQLLWWVFSRASLTLPLEHMALLPLLSMTGISFLLLFSGTALLASLAGAYCALHAIALLLTTINPKFFKLDEHLAFSSLMLFGFSLVAVYFLEVELLNLALVLCPVGLMLVWPWLPLKPAHRFGQLTYAVVLSAIPIAIAVYPVFKDYMATGY